MSAEQLTANAGEAVGKGKHSFTVVDIQIGIATLGTSVENPQKLKITLPYGPAIPLFGRWPKNLTFCSTTTCSASSLSE